MKEKQQTREQLLVELAKVRVSHADWVSGNENRLKEFAKVFNWYKKRGQYDYTDTLAEPTWIEVFIELGKLLERQKRLDYITGFENLNMQVRELDLEVKNLKQEKQ